MTTSFIAAVLCFGQPSLAQAQPYALKSSSLETSSGEATSGGAPLDPTELAVDDGVPENEVALPDGGEFVWMNVLTPPPDLCPYRVESVRVLWPDDEYLAVGDTADVYLYTDADGDHSPATGAEFRTALEDVTAQFVDGTTFSEYVLPQALEVDGCDDLIVAVVNTGMTGEAYAAAVDTSVPRGRSWLGLYDDAVPRPPPLPAPIFGQLGDLAPLDGNFTIRAVVAPLVVSIENGPMPERFVLGPAFPNPTRDASTVRYYLGVPGPVVLTLYDVLGREVARHVRTTLGVGEHEAAIGTKGLVPGLYVWRLHAGDRSATGMVTVLN